MVYCSAYGSHAPQQMNAARSRRLGRPRPDISHGCSRTSVLIQFHLNKITQIILRTESISVHARPVVSNTCPVSVKTVTNPSLRLLNAPLDRHVSSRLGRCRR